MVQCRSCSDPADKKCTGCSRARYCTDRCQKADWVRHIFDCNLRRGINTADYLALAVHENLLPNDPQTCLDYGFTTASTASDRAKLLGLYAGVISTIGIKPRMLHKWRLQGILIQKIKGAYEILPAGDRGGYYQWFLKNERVLSTPAQNPANQVWEMQKGAWVFIGESAEDDEAVIKAKMATWREKKQHCFSFYTVLLAGILPGPTAELWVNLGFCACRDPFEAHYLGRLYEKFMHKCAFDEFVAAYESSTLFGLLDSKNSHYKPISGLEDALSGSPTKLKSIWWLKQFVMVDEYDKTKIRPAVHIDYGFVNCKDDDDWKALKGLYKDAFEMPAFDPVQLREAASRGRLFEFMSGKVDLKGEKERFSRLLQNFYPLPMS